MRFRLSLFVGVVSLMASGPAVAVEPFEIHYAPAENLERVDVALLRAARSKIDLTAYVLTDWPVIDALIEAHRRGVAVRIVLDPSQGSDLDRLREVSGSIRINPPGPFMHLKSYSVDGLLLRSGSANLTASGLKQQDNDVIVIRDRAAVRAFEARFQQIWSEAKPIAVANPVATSPALGPVSAKAAAPAGCAIKGNISRQGERIFHKPGEQFYDRVQVDKSAGERWFCSEAEAVAAGWRRAGGN